MPAYTYTARTRNGEKSEGTMQASDKRSALALLQNQGLVPIAVKEEGASAAPKAKAKGKTKKPAPKKAMAKKFTLTAHPNAKKKMKLQEMLIFTRELSDLLSSGMTLGTALESMARRNSETASGAITAELMEEIVQGISLSEAMAKRPQSFPTFYVSLVEAGEAGGQISLALDNLVTYYERLIEAKDKVTGALIYPCIVLVIGIATIVFCMIFVIPRFSIIFDDLGSTLPMSTRMLMGMSDFFVRYIWALVLVHVAGVILFSKWVKTDAGRFTWDGIILKMPVIKTIINANAFSNFARTLGGLLEGGVPVLKALGISGKTVGNRVISDQVTTAIGKVTDGSSISRPLAEGGIFPPLFTDMLEVGEHSGNVSGSLKHIAKRYDDELNRNIKVFTTLLEPLMMLFMALAVGFVAMSLMMAVFDMTNGLDI